MPSGQGAFHAFGVVRNDGEIGTGGLVGFAAALFPIAESAERDVIPRGKFFLCQGEGAA